MENQPSIRAYINMAALKLEAENAVIAQMNKLGRFRQRYEALCSFKIERQNI
jgi:hypothetical protein